ncbi:2',3'-cyclic-nucleotide 2'-phosphodiesterase/5'-or 3'-nucleotidase, 5'-nucleotidase family [Prauserella marina]|uniref:2',3'-cyclic-nucleotide 2'-phosphodiesterase/5'-or 3'-nucleotidase, 5'-nucleotidase family n=1 Tax=Prauserella marina TaxID=530584 RepID=A0A1G6UTB9_9PSEU|nr:metallophosphoesterase [Prauserella marina]PWV74663.1 2',3'-cyclic-nucleotide 2'-phosphodiesterase (5'-nucleotidase family) [Prauserella marina]SDD43956.1 2',3'-cyclic-nucleotide 2'-phosphodiesterase/5'-or 3'-nucleotidase, 5'-nucleotidase family [Prauserella marina]
MTAPETLLRILTTNDFLGSYFAHPTSYGTYPGAGALTHTIDRLREGARHSLWIDAGDFAQGPLAYVMGGHAGFTAAASLGIDVAVPGNHEFDWGERQLREWGPATGFPLLLGNYDLGFPSHTVFSFSGIGVGVIGLTHPDIERFTGPLALAQSPAPEVIPEIAQLLRSNGADVVVLTVHDGVDWVSMCCGPPRADHKRITEFTEAMRPHADIIIGGHTLGRHIGQIAGVPYLQPWALGSEVGVLDLRADLTHSCYGITPSGGHVDWTGPGHELHVGQAANIVGELRESLRWQPRQNNSLGHTVAKGLTMITETDAALVGAINTSQAPLDGVFSFLPRGTLSEAELLHVTGRTARVMACEVSRAELDALRDTATGKNTLSDDVTLNIENLGGLGMSLPDAPRRPVVSLATEAHLVASVERALDREVEWTPVQATLPEALLAAIN